MQEPRFEKRSSTSKPPPMQPQQAINLEQPFLPNQRISSTSQSPAAGGGRLAGAAPVAPAPIAAAAAHGPHQVVQQHQLTNEDVMEAPGGQFVHRGHQTDFGDVSRCGQIVALMLILVHLLPRAVFPPATAAAPAALCLPSTAAAAPAADRPSQPASPGRQPALPPGALRSERRPPPAAGAGAPALTSPPAAGAPLPAPIAREGN